MIANSHSLLATQQLTFVGGIGMSENVPPRATRSYIGMWRVIAPTNQSADAHPRPAPKAITSAPRKFCIFGVKVIQILR
jgi:hypothetical protein